MNTTANANLFCRLFDNLDEPNRLAIEMPGFDDRFRPPRGNADQTLLAAARAFARDAAPYRFRDRISGEAVELSERDFSDLCTIHL